MTTLALVCLFLLLLLNAFFVLAEFSVVKVRSTQIDALERTGVRGAAALRIVQEDIDAYLNVCQLGVTLASIGLGYLGEPAIAQVLERFMGEGATTHAIAITLSLLVISFLHILLGEQVPKSMALRMTERMALLSAPVLIAVGRLVHVPLAILNLSVRLTLRLLRLPAQANESAVSEAEVRVILDRSQQEGLMPFRRLLLVENVFDFGTIQVRDVMRGAHEMVLLRVDRPWNEIRDTIVAHPHARFPLVEGDPPRPLGVLHLTDLVSAPQGLSQPLDLRALARKVHLTRADVPLEGLLVDLRRERTQMALVQGADDALAGLITWHDVVAPLVGVLDDQATGDVAIRLADCLREECILGDLTASTAEAAIEEIVRRCDTSALGLDKAVVIDAVIERERSLSTCLGRGIAVPHARLEGIEGAHVLFARAPRGVRFGAGDDQLAEVILMLLTPASAPGLQLQLLAHLASLRESVFAWDRLRNATDAAAVLEAVRGSDEMRAV
jgi:CBS domain containing-hemolysin-like protein